MDGWIDGCTNGPLDGRIGTDLQMYSRTDGWFDGRMDRLMDGWTDGRMEILID